MLDSIPAADPTVPPAVPDDSPLVRPALLRPTRRARRSLGDLVERFGGRLVSAGASTGASEDGSVVLTGIAASSLDVAPGDLFAGMPGGTVHGARFAAQARGAGAAAVVTDVAGAMVAAGSDLPVVVLDDPRARLASLSAWMFAAETGTPTLFGVTGTNGKTSTVTMLHALLTALGVRTAMSTTVERRLGSTSVPSRLTTPEAPELHTMLAAMREDGAAAIALEVSAHGVSRGRVDGVVFDVVGFTNLSHDHLDEYADMTRYLEAKAALFTPEHARRGVVLVDDDHGARLAERASIPVQTISSRPDARADWTVRIESERASSTAFSLTAPDGTVLHSCVPLLGRHMAVDACLAIAMLAAAGHSLAEVSAALGPEGLQVDVPGRSERVSGDDGPLVLVDFSHNGSAFEATLRGLRQVTQGSVIMLVGADGDRDPSKREHMGRLAAAHCDVLIVTDHHPRTEDPAAIRAALLRGAAQGGADALEVPCPAEAIRRAVSLAGPGDAILWAGPGRIDYRVVGTDRVPYSPRRDARAALREAGWA